MTKVACAVLRDYDEGKVQEAVDRALLCIGGLTSFISPGQKVMIKPNLMRKSHPDEAAVTHPAVVRAVAKRCVELGAQVLIAESPGGVYNAGAMKAIYEAVGLYEVAQDTGAVLNEDFSEETVAFPEGQSVKELPIISPALWADVIIDVPKAKSHTLAVYSGAVKNLYGLVPGLKKAEFHFRFPDITGFSGMIVDICHRFRPVLTVMDAVVAMEGEGPGSGDPRPVGAILASACPYAADMATASLLGYSAEEIPMLKLGMERGECEGTVEWTGDSPEEVRITDFVRASQSGNHLLTGKVPKFLQKPLENLLALKPKISKEKCVGCGICMRTCPPKAIEIVNHKATVRRDKCIQCFCCLEFCPQKAIEAHRNWLFRLASKITGEVKK